MWTAYLLEKVLEDVHDGRMYCICKLSDSCEDAYEARMEGLWTKELGPLSSRTAKTTTHGHARLTSNMLLEALLAFHCPPAKHCQFENLHRPVYIHQEDHHANQGIDRSDYAMRDVLLPQDCSWSCTLRNRGCDSPSSPSGFGYGICSRSAQAHDPSSVL